ncbi:hypothetical protein BT67DRAFT_441764 [Trichocladium antarcticum]|uniref:Sensitive to high expression protein 9, mitochondrial n=1 Tax=Trichocladium antarcticum TaxID=1450529 RepID=A0AAN6UKB3_9PEZI|nr:hypothetical protein BT67DRAFT_441764 [Trichocladium antarcticum]
MPLLPLPELPLPRPVESDRRVPQAGRARAASTMSPHTALRLAARPLRGVQFLDQLAAAAAPKPLPPLSPICRRRHISVDLRSAAGHARRFSTAPPPPKQHNPTDGTTSRTSSSSSSSSPETAIPLGAPSATTPSSPPPPPPPPETPKEPEQPESEPSTQPEQPAASEPSPSSSHPDPSAQPPPNNSDDPSLPSFTETHRHPLSVRFSTMMDNLQSRAVTATQTLNDLTGYTAIEAIKHQNTVLESELAAAQHRLRAARQDYKSLTSHRAATQREVTTLLARKDTWNPTDLERFTTLYRADHELEAQVNAAAAELTEAETDETRLSGQLNQGILRRYHEEQIWSDRIRRQSTWGTWGLMGVNVLLFLGLQFVAEPWRRKRLVNGIVESERGVMDEVRRELGEVKAVLEAAAAAAAAREAAELQQSRAADREAEDGESVFVVDAHVPETAATLVQPPPVEEGPRKPWKEVVEEYWADPEALKTDVRETVQDLYSERRADLRMRDVSLIALQGAAAGATVAATLAFALLRSARA